ncbi:MAG: tRNA (guanosine(37)-N1)-methyltransferase TrmD [Patescibacteria group bacterium]
MKFDIITIFPDIFDSYFNKSILKRAQDKRLIKVKAHNLRDFTKDKHRVVDDTPYGGGPGMVIKIQPVYDAVSCTKTRKHENTKTKRYQSRVVLFSTRGRKFTEKEARRLAKYDQLILICGRYEGVDERVAKKVADEEISIGDFVLSGGELPAMVVVEAVSRFIPGVLGKRESLESVKGSYPVYTKPEIFINKTTGKKWRAPKVLLSGDHKKIEEWRKRYGR